MPYELYWRGPLNAYFIYADKANREREHENEIAWSHGLYVHKAIASILDSKKFPYPAEPIKPKKQLTPEQEQKKDEIAEMIREHNLLIQVQMEGNIRG